MLSGRDSTHSRAGNHCDELLFDMIRNSFENENKPFVFGTADDKTMSKNIIREQGIIVMNRSMRADLHDLRTPTIGVSF